MDKVRGYIATELQNASAATGIVNAIIDAAEHPIDFPKTCAPLPSIANVESDYRFLVHGNYLAFYRVRGEEVYDDRVLYGRITCAPCFGVFWKRI